MTFFINYLSIRPNICGNWNFFSPPELTGIFFFPPELTGIFFLPPGLVF